MDIYEYLKLDHAHVAHLFKQFNETDNKFRRQQIIGFIAQELIVHARSEQETFYKELEHHFKSKQKAFHGWEEHQEIEDKLDKILHTKSFGPTWIKSVNQLKKLVEHHVKEEEGSIFRAAKRVLSKEKAYLIKEEMHYLKQQILKDFEKKKDFNLKAA